MSKTYSLFELNEHIRRVLALNFSSPAWIKCELAQVDQSNGHYYLNLVEKAVEEDKIIAQAEAIIWYKTFRKLKKAIGPEIQHILKAGVQVCLQVSVNFHERYGYKLMIEDIDLSYTLGQLELQKQKTIATLQEKGLLNKNKSLPLPRVLQRIAIFSSPTAAGYHDFIQQLSHNSYGYAYHYQLFPVAVQGQEVGKDIRKQLRQINLKQYDFDCVVLVRGGGAKLDLAAFDQLQVCESLATCPLPILCGIGHEIDETVTDLIAHTPLKTPTAVADFLIEKNLAFESTLIRLGMQSTALVNQLVKEELFKIHKLEQQIHYLPQLPIRENYQKLVHLKSELATRTEFTLQSETSRLQALEEMITLLHPSSAFKRGFSMTTQNGKVLTSTTELTKGDQIKTHFSDGAIESTID